MAVSEIEHIRKSIRMHLMDLHIMITHDQVNMDIAYYNDVTLALLKAEDMLKDASVAHEKRIQEHLKKYGLPNKIVD